MKANKSEKIRTLLNTGKLTIKQIAKRVGVSPNYVYNVQWKDGKKPKKPGLITMDTPVVELASREEATGFIPTPDKPLTDTPLSEILATLDMEIAYLKSIRDYLVQE